MDPRLWVAAIVGTFLAFLAGFAWLGAPVDHYNPEPTPPTVTVTADPVVDYAERERLVKRGAALVRQHGCSDAPPVAPVPYVIDGYRFLDGWQVVATQSPDEDPMLWDKILVMSAWEQYTGAIDWGLTIYGWCAPEVDHGPHF